jgi:hypothetical protein
MTAEIKSKISRALIVQIASFKILSSLRIANSMTSINFDDLENSTIVNLLFKARDINNVKIEFRRDTLDSFSFVQTLIRELNQEN